VEGVTCEEAWAPSQTLCAKAARHVRDDENERGKTGCWVRFLTAIAFVAFPVHHTIAAPPPRKRVSLVVCQMQTRIAQGTNLHVHRPPPIVSDRGQMGHLSRDVHAALTPWQSSRNHERSHLLSQFLADRVFARPEAGGTGSIHHKHVHGGILAEG
jgi:hypothetical protein